MGNMKRLVCMAVAIAFLLSVGVSGASAGKKPMAEKEWTILMYWDADNSLEFCTEFAMGTWESALTSNAEVNIVALVDILSEDGIWIYEIYGGDRHLVAEWDEMNSSDPDVLEKFALYGMKEFPALKTMLVVQDHGFGWRGICQDKTHAPGLMSIDGLASALESVKSKTGGRGVDLLAFDACNMATVEVAYELRDAVSYMVGSETMVPFDGLPYEMFIGDLMRNPELTPSLLAENIVHEYVLYYSSKWDYEHIMTYSQDFATMAAFDMSKMSAVGGAFTAMVDSLMPLVPDHVDEIEMARGYALVGTWTNMAGYEWMPDAYVLFDGLKAIEGHPELTSAVDGFEAAFDAAVVAQASSEKYHDSVTGLNIWFPPSLSQYNSQGYIWARQFVYHASSLDLVTESQWDELLMSYYSAT